MAYAERRTRRADDIWPGFVDVLATLLIIIIFVLLVFVLGQFFLGQAISGRDDALARLSRQVTELSRLLSIERQDNRDLKDSLRQLSGDLEQAQARLEQLPILEAEREQLSARLRAALAAAEAPEGLRKELETAYATMEADRETIRTQLRELALLRADIEALRALREKLEKDIAALDAKTQQGDRALAEERRISEEARTQAALLAQRLEALRDEVQRLAQLLAAAEARDEEQEAQIADLGQRLNRALASRVQELQRYRSEFFGRLRQILGDREGIRIEGDRFVFSSEVLFESGSATLGEAGRERIGTLAETLLQLAKEIPPEIDWVLRVDGHTDRRPITTPQFPSNWELSAARAISVVNFLHSRGVPNERLAAAGFAEFRPLDPGDSPAALARNRRIELKLDQR